MFAHRLKIMIPESHEVLVQLPKALPSGEAEVIVLAELAEPAQPPDPVDAWLAAVAAGVPQSPIIPLEALRRENLYE